MGTTTAFCTTCFDCVLVHDSYVAVMPVHTARDAVRILLSRYFGDAGPGQVASPGRSSPTAGVDIRDTDVWSLYECETGGAAVRAIDHDEVLVEVRLRLAHVRADSRTCAQVITGWVRAAVAGIPRCADRCLLLRCISIPPALPAEPCVSHVVRAASACADAKSGIWEAGRAQLLGQAVSDVLTGRVECDTDTVTATAAAWVRLRAHGP
jgi:hypothetical protein